MDIVDTIRKHAAAMQLPLYAVTLSTVPKKQAPALMILHWHGFRRTTTVQLPGIDFPKRAVPGSPIYLEEDWTEMAFWDQALLDAAWQLGAWDLERATRRPWWRLNAPQAETLECYRAFGCYPDAEAGQSVSDPTDQKTGTLLELAAQLGYVRWLFRPRIDGIWANTDGDDATLDQLNGRSLPCPIPPASFDRHKPGRQRYRLGRGAAIVRVSSAQTNISSKPNATC